MSSQNQISVCNISLLGLGVQQQISSLNEGSVQANACATLYGFVFEQYARNAQWGCLKKQDSLTLIQAAQGTPENPNGTSLPIPQQPWLYAYLYPADALLIRQLLPPVNGTAGGAIPQFSIANAVTPAYLQNQEIINYEIGYTTDAKGNPLQVILTNQQQAVCDYTVNQPNPQSWDSLFTAGFCAALGVYLVPALSLDKSLMQLQLGIAEKMIKMAEAQDGSESPQSQDRVPDWISARSGATGYGLRGYSGYGLMPFPS